MWLQRRGGSCCRFFFFFQAEDGIRDVAVTGVQTCALPISPRSIRAGLLPALPVSLADPSRPVFRSADWRCGSLPSLGSTDRQRGLAGEIGRGSGRGRGERSGGAGSFKKKKKNNGYQGDESI